MAECADCHLQPAKKSHTFFCENMWTLCLFFRFSWSLLYGEAARLCGERLSGGFPAILPLHNRPYEDEKEQKICPPALDGYHHAAIGKVFWRDGKVIWRSTVHRRVQLGLGERGGDRRQFRQTNEAAQANDARKEGAIWGFGARIFALPVFEGLQEMREAVDSGQDFQEGDVSLLWKDAQEREMG